MIRLPETGFSNVKGSIWNTLSLVKLEKNHTILKLKEVKGIVSVLVITVIRKHKVVHHNFYESKSENNNIYLNF